MLYFSVSKCPIEKGYIRNDDGECVCPPGTALNHEDECRRCIVELGYKVDENGRCVCALDRGLIIDERGRCICPTDYGYSLNVYGQCVPSTLLYDYTVINAENAVAHFGVTIDLRNTFF